MKKTKIYVSITFYTVLLIAVSLANGAAIVKALQNTPYQTEEDEWSDPEVDEVDDIETDESDTVEPETDEPEAEEYKTGDEETDEYECVCETDECVCETDECVCETDECVCKPETPLPEKPPIKILDDVLLYPLFSQQEMEDPNIWYAIPDHTVLLAATPVTTVFTRLHTAIRQAQPGVTHIVIPFHINTGAVTGDATAVRVPDDATVVLIGAHPTAENGQIVISDTHTGTNISRPFRVRGNNTQQTALVFRNVVLQRGGSGAQATPATPPAPTAVASQTGTSRGGGVTMEQTDGGGGHFVLCRGAEIRNSTTDNNGPIDVQTNGRFTMMPGSIVHNNAAGNSGGGIHVGTNATFTMHGGTIHSNLARGENTASPTARAVGGAVFIQNGGTFNMYDGEIYNNSASLGAVATAPTATNAIVTSCGGAVFITGATSTFNMYGGTIRDNNATRTRSSAIANATRTTLRSGNGGGVYATGGASFNMEGGFIQNNIATASGTVTVSNALNLSNGGGVYLTGSGTTFHMTGGAILNNRAVRTVNSVPTAAAAALHIVTGNGGGVHVFDGASFTMDAGDIYENTAHATGDPPAHNVNGIVSLSNGGGVFVSGTNSTLTMNGGTISDNNAAGSVAAASSFSGNGGGVHVVSNARFNMHGGTVSNNSATSTAAQTLFRGNGAGVYINGATLDMTGGSIRDHTNVTRNGVGIFLTGGGTMNLDNTAEIINNTSQNNGGGIFLEDSGVLNMNGGSITGNTAQLSGGGVFLTGIGVSFDMGGGTIGDADNANTAYQGGGVGIHGGSFTMIGHFANVDRNYATIGGGIYVASNGQFNGIDGSIINNQADDDGGGIFTEAYDYVEILPANAYSNLYISDRFIFDNNSASRLSNPPSNPEILTHIASATSSVPGIHVLNNYDINYWISPFIRMTTFSFTKADLSIYNDPPQINPIPYAEFAIFGNEAGNWIQAGDTQTSDENGQVTFELTPGVEYRLQEISVPSGYRSPPGHWLISATGIDTHEITPMEGNHIFVLINGRWHVGNDPETATFRLHKTDNRLYNYQNWANIDELLLAGATFELYRYNGNDPDEAIDVIGPDMVGNAPGQWLLVDTATSTNIQSQPILFELSKGGIYQLVETQAPLGFELPRGQWRIIAETNSDGDVNFVITSRGDHTIPAFAAINGYFYVGNRPALILPLSGGAGTVKFMLTGFAFIILSLGLALHVLASQKQQYQKSNLRSKSYEKN